MLPGIGWTEVMVILGLFFFFFGYNRTRHIVRFVGRGVNEVRRVKDKIEEDIGIAQFRQMKSDVLREVNDAANSVIDITAEPKSGREKKTGAEDGK